MNCPRCGAAGAVQLFTSVACDACDRRTASSARPTVVYYERTAASATFPAVTITVGHSPPAIVGDRSLTFVDGVLVHEHEHRAQMRAEQQRYAAQSTLSMGPYLVDVDHIPLHDDFSDPSNYTRATEYAKNLATFMEHFDEKFGGPLQVYDAAAVDSLADHRAVFGPPRKPGAPPKRASWLDREAAKKRGSVLDVASFDSMLKEVYGSVGLQQWATQSKMQRFMSGILKKAALDSILFGTSVAEESERQWAPRWFDTPTPEVAYVSPATYKRLVAMSKSDEPFRVSRRAVYDAPIEAEDIDLDPADNVEYRSRTDHYYDAATYAMWGTGIAEQLMALDTHDHTSGPGVPIPEWTPTPAQAAAISRAGAAALAQYEAERATKVPSWRDLAEAVQEWTTEVYTQTGKPPPDITISTPTGLVHIGACEAPSRPSPHAFKLRMVDRACAWCGRDEEDAVHVEEDAPPPDRVVAGPLLQQRINAPRAPITAGPPPPVVCKLTCRCCGGKVTPKSDGRRIECYCGSTEFDG